MMPRLLDLALLVGGAPPHQPGCQLAEVAPLEDVADALRDRKLDPEPAREIAQHRSRGQALDDRADLRLRLLGGRATRDQLARLSVASEPAPAGHDQVAHAGEPGKRLRPPPTRLAEPRHL